jgi:hypothetical protein
VYPDIVRRAVPHRRYGRGCEGLVKYVSVDSPLPPAYLIFLGQISGFVHHLRRIYRLENSYHNFEHALDVLQASYSYLRSAGMVPPLSILLESDRKWKLDRAFDSGPLMTTLGLQELFVVYVIAIGHDVGHPGFTNMFMASTLEQFSTFRSTDLLI